MYWVSEDIRRAGAGEVMVMTDQEAALRALMEPVQLKRDWLVHAGRKRGGKAHRGGVPITP